MGALNQEETQSLLLVEELLKQVQEHGFDPRKAAAALAKTPRARTPADNLQMNLAKSLELGRRRIHTVTVMKGNYPKG